MKFRPFTLGLLALLTVMFTAGSCAAAETPLASPLLADYWSGFIDHWKGVFQRQNGIVMGVTVIGALCLFIITRGKWRK